MKKLKVCSAFNTADESKYAENVEAAHFVNTIKQSIDANYAGGAACAPMASEKNNAENVEAVAFVNTINQSIDVLNVMAAVFAPMASQNPIVHNQNAY